MKKRCLLISALLIVCVLFGGCYRTEVNVKIKKNAGFSVTEQVLVTRAYYQEDDSKKISAGTVYKKLKADVKKEFPKSKKTLKFRKIKKTVKGEKYYGYIVTGIKSSEYKDSIQPYKKNGRVYLKLDMTEAEDEDAEKVSPDQLSDLAAKMRKGGISVKFNFTFPRKPKTSYGTVKKKTVTIDVLKYLEKHPKGGKIVMSSKI